MNSGLPEYLIFSIQSRIIPRFLPFLNETEVIASNDGFKLLEQLFSVCFPLDEPTLFSKNNNRESAAVFYYDIVVFETKSIRWEISGRVR